MNSVKGIIKTEKIGEVNLRYIKEDRFNDPVYSDGPIENELYHKFKHKLDNTYNNDNSGFHSWAYEYHISPVRTNLLKWYPFRSNGNVLEVGCGCGAAATVIGKGGGVTAPVGL